MVRKHLLLCFCGCFELGDGTWGNINSEMVGLGRQCELAAFFFATSYNGGQSKQAHESIREAAMSKVNIAEKFAGIHDFYNPRVAAELNGQCIKLVKFDSPFVFHHHDNEDEMFLVVKGRFRMEFKDHHEWIEQGEFIVIPRGVEHRPVAEEECWVILFEPASTLNTGNVVNERTVRELEHV